MSDENTPKIRLRPKLAGAPPAITPASVNPPAEEAVPEVAVSLPAATPTEVKPAAPRAKLALKTGGTTPPIGLSNTTSPLAPKEPAAPQSFDPRTFAPPPAKPVLVARSKVGNPAEGEKSPVATGATPPFPTDTTKKKFPVLNDAPPSPETWPAVLDASPPPGLAPVGPPSGTYEEPAEITAIRKASTFPFPSPTAKFPPLPGLGASIASEPPEVPAAEGFLKKLLLIGALFIVLLAAAGFAYFKFFAKTSTQVKTPPATAASTPEKSKLLVAAEKLQQAQQAPLNEAIAADPGATAAQPAVKTTPSALATAAATDTVSGAVLVEQPAAVPEPAPVAVKSPPPQPSLVFKAWVANMKIRGVKGGDSPRVFIDKTSYVPGDVVNQQLGIIFTGYNESTRVLSFQDKTGATFERRH